MSSASFINAHDKYRNNPSSNFDFKLKISILRNSKFVNWNFKLIMQLITILPLPPPHHPDFHSNFSSQSPKNNVFPPACKAQTDCFTYRFLHLRMKVSISLSAKELNYREI